MKNSIFVTFFFCIITLSNISCKKTQKNDSVINSLPKTDSIAKVNHNAIPKEDLVKNIKEVITTKYLQPEDVKIIDSTDRKFSFQEIDLNDDGKKEIFVEFFTPYFCGTGGCSLLLLDSNFNIINRFTVTETPIYISPDLKNDWKVIFAKSKGNWKALEFENGKYPSNPSVIKNSKSQPGPESTIIFKDQNDSKFYTF